MKRAAAIYFGVLACYIATAGGHLYSPDEEVLFRTAQAIAKRGSLAIKPYGDIGFSSRPATPPRPDGREFGQYGIGQPILAVPLCWIGAALGRTGGDAFWNRMTQNCYSFLPAGERAERWACSWFNILLGPLLAAMIYLIAGELGADRRGATLAALSYALGSLAWAHSRPFFTEICAVFFILLAWWAVLRGLRGGTAWFVLAGAAAGYAALVRMDSVFAYAGLGLVMLGPVVHAARLQGRSHWPAWIAFAAPAMACGFVLVLLNKLHFGAWLSTGYEDQPEGVHFSSPLAPGLYGLLFSVGKGLFFFSPALALSFLGWRHLLNALRGLKNSALERGAGFMLAGIGLSIAVPLLVHAKWPNWAGGWCWGPRHIFVVHPFLALPIAAWLTHERGAAARIATAVMLAVGAAVQLFGSSQDFILFHQRAFRSPGDPLTAHVIYDEMDREFWGSRFQLAIVGADSRLHPVSLVPPAPIQSSIFNPQHSVWAVYPLMLRDGMLDNFWIGLARDGEAQP